MTAPASATTAVCRPAVPCGHPTSLGGGEQKLNNVVTISTNGSNGPWIYKGDETGLNSKAAYGPAANAATNTKKSNIKFGYGNGILSRTHRH